MAWTFKRLNFLIAALVATSTCMSAEVRLSPGTSAVPAGVDFGLHRQCVRTVSPSLPNFFEDVIDCTGKTYPTKRYWTTAVAIENQRSAGKGTCLGAGPADQSVPINSVRGPIFEHWTGNRENGYTVELKTDYRATKNVCAAPTFTWVPIMDNWVGGGPLPNPDRLYVRFATRFDRRLSPGSGTAATGATRAFGGWSGQWKALGPNGTIGVASLSIEVDYFVDPAWGKQLGTPPDVIAYKRGGAFGYYVALNGAKLVPSVTTSPGIAAKELSFNWPKIIGHVLAEKLFPAPVKGWDDAATATTAAFAGSEVFNTHAGAGGPMADLFVAGFEEFSL